MGDDDTFIELYGGGNGENVRLGCCLTSCALTVSVLSTSFQIVHLFLSWQINLFLGPSYDFVDVSKRSVVPTKVYNLSKRTESRIILARRRGKGLRQGCSTRSASTLIVSMGRRELVRFFSLSKYLSVQKVLQAKSKKKGPFIR